MRGTNLEAGGRMSESALSRPAQLDHMNFTVTDIDESVRWYGAVFGFDPVERDTLDDGTRWAIVLSGSSMLCMYEHPERGAPVADGDHHSLSHFGLRIHDRAAWEETVERHGVAVQYGGPVRWPLSTSWYVVDPSGWEIEVALWDDDSVRFPDDT